MSTVNKGDFFEEKSFKLIEDAINSQQLGIIPAQCTIYKKKKYYSKDRESDIIFDLAIEVWPPGAQRYTLLCIIECKSYSNHKVPVSDVEEFHDKIKQVAGVHVKGIFITDNTFQDGAFRYAKSKGIMLIEAGDDNSYDIKLHKINRSSNIYNGYNSIKELKDEQNFDAPLILGINSTAFSWNVTLENFFTNLFKNKPFKSSKENNQVQGLLRLSNESIEKITTDILTSFDPGILIYHDKISLSKFIIYLNQKYSLKTDFNQDLGFDSNGNKIIGFYNNASKSIFIDHSIQLTERFSFVLAHELGHFFLHSKLTLDQEVYDNFKDSEYNLILGKHELVNAKHWIEWQANQFAASLLMQKNSISVRLIMYQINHGIRNKGTIYYDNQQVNREDFF
ncbi:ImmA/IrrE family metallo-endopeptidase [Adhaeribacter pallidiroseus]|uniref:IrrE N-terminal-like domain-containing protein n=1 Tax=Adhaeribacter pallidiroseus TaxID=2072847 RepID=A0A369QP95_9BACT|nr:ImmA/IrrE family metallo-endopeptidase [Adhaeribacter pallidiroseus]RDC66210.1 hypothetical protein AHMF7616_04841 [Adhaeribacter pallidiroseus]